MSNFIIFVQKYYPEFLNLELKLFSEYESKNMAKSNDFFYHILEFEEKVVFGQELQKIT